MLAALSRIVLTFGQSRVADTDPLSVEFRAYFWTGASRAILRPRGQKRSKMCEAASRPNRGLKQSVSVRKAVSYDPSPKSPRLRNCYASQKGIV